ncbi:MAG: TauD/TfdA family dioxygenase [Alphaproteobacteria bacterium]|nr:TauD/TfdA family dioxygenase [Alphaproteobacteria bacterium]
MAITVTPLGSPLGAEVSGIDLSKPVDAAAKEQLSNALAEHLALVFHDQTLTPDQYLQAATIFGPPMRQHYSQHNMPDHPDIGLVHHRNGQKVSERWHTDHTNRVRPPAATMLYGVEIPTSGGGTSIANMRIAYNHLPDKERSRIEGYRTVNSLDEGRRETTKADDWEKYSKPITHPMVRTHPVTGERAVFFHIGKTVNIEGMGQDETQEYLTGLLDRMLKPEIIYTHKWRKGDLLVFDDRATMHRAHGDYDRSQSRVLWRIIVEGDEPRFA